MAQSIAGQRVLAVSSGGGHWVELLRVMAAFDGARVTYVTVNAEYRNEVKGERFRVINDATRWSRVALITMALRLLWIIVRERPHVIVTTGAAPGYFALRFGRWFRAKTIWIDSIANVDELSMSGRIARRYADLWLTQWEHLAGDDGPEYAGAVL
jgi:hypothetical protein